MVCYHIAFEYHYGKDNNIIADIQQFTLHLMYMLEDHKMIKNGRVNRPMFDSAVNLICHMMPF